MSRCGYLFDKLSERGSATLQAALLLPAILALAVFGFATLIASNRAADLAQQASVEASSVAVLAPDLASARSAAVLAVDRLSAEKAELSCSVVKVSGALQPGSFLEVEVVCNHLPILDSPFVGRTSSYSSAVAVVDSFRSSSG